ncbi:MAG: ankyrin repeat domain-containing protein [Synergistaceae bacterium]|jgi:ankyrin repeat protein|nr:ankyrin repeat domain-containing protein [Synergistaceae bacterium]
MKFLTDFLQRLKLVRHGDAEGSPETAEKPENSQKPEELPEKPKRWKKFKIAGGICVAAGVVALGAILWGVLRPAVTVQTRAPEERGPAPLSAVEKDLFQAIRNDNAGDIRRCLNSGADVNAEDISGITPIRAAIALNRIDAVRALLNAGYDESSGDGSSLIYAIVQNRSKITRELLESAAEKGTAGRIINRIDKNGRTPLMYAIARNHAAIAQELLDAGADANKIDKEGYTPLMRAVTVGKADMVAVLLSAGADINAVSPEGETAMSIARRRNKQVVVSLLLEASRAGA